MTYIISCFRCRFLKISHSSILRESQLAMLGASIFCDGTKFVFKSSLLSNIMVLLDFTALKAIFGIFFSMRKYRLYKHFSLSLSLSLSEECPRTLALLAGFQDRTHL